MIVADTDVSIDFLMGREPGAAMVEQHLEQADLRMTAVTRYELLRGVQTLGKERLARQLFSVVPTLPLDGAAADAAARVRRTLEAAGQSIGTPDTLIAGSVISTGALLLTRNVRHFSRIPELRLL